MRCRNSDARVKPKLPHEISDTRRRHNARAVAHRPERTHARYERTFQHVRGDSRVVTNKNLWCMLCLFCQYVSTGAPKAKRQLRRQLRVRNTAYSIRSEQSSHFISPSNYAPVPQSQIYIHQRQTDDVIVIAVDFLDEQRTYTLYGISSGFIERLSGVNICVDFGVC